MARRHEPANRGGQALQQWLRDERRSQAWLADQLRHEGEQLHQTTVSTWIGGKVPAIAFAVRLETITGIPVRWWTEPAVMPGASASADGGGSHTPVDAHQTG